MNLKRLTFVDRSITATNSASAIGGGRTSQAALRVTVVFQINSSAEMPRLRQYPNRYMQSLIKTL